ncbi:MAG TPA: hypothetical protein VEG34_01100, partial [Thermoanaerobaculia bacterium]|nr:hypothetical protein [Thermoanaerobaculia bacterium]
MDSKLVLSRVVWAAGGLAATLLAASTAPMEPPARPRRVLVEPNAIEHPDNPMAITVEGVPAGERAWLAVLRDCSGDGQPDPRGRGRCKSPVYQRSSRPAGSDLRVSDELEFAGLERAGEALFPRKTTLWLRVSALVAGGRGPAAGYVEATFRLDQDVCGLWRTVADTFLRGRCDPGLLQALRQHLGPAGLEAFTFQVSRLDPEGGPPVAVPGTRGATGVAWIDAGTLAVTIGPVVAERDPLAPGPPALDPAVQPGLFHVPLPDGPPQLLWRPDGEDAPAAPLALPGGRIAFVRQGPAETGEGPAARLCVWSPERVAPCIALPDTIHQLVAADARGGAVLALTLGRPRPAFLAIDLATGVVRDLGYHHALYHAALRAPTGERAAVALEDNSGM